MYLPLQRNPNEQTNKSTSKFYDTANPPHPEAASNH